MKKFILGVLVGASIAVSGSVYADNIKSLIGAAVQGEIPVKLNGHEFIQKAIVVDGSSYMPVRVLSEALGVEVSYDPDKGVNLVDERPIPVKVVPPAPATDSKGKELELFKGGLNLKTIAEVDEMLNQLKVELKTITQLIQTQETYGSVWDDDLYKKAKGYVVTLQRQIEYLEQLKTTMKY